MSVSVNRDIGSALESYRRASEHLASILEKETPASLAEKPLKREKSRSDWTPNLPLLPLAAAATSDLDRPPTRVNPHESLRVYIAGCEGLKSLAREFCLPLYKIGTTQGDLLQRLAELDADKYAANYRHGKKMVTEPGFNRWNLTTLDFDLPKAPNSPIWMNLAPCVSDCPVRLRRMLSSGFCAMRLLGFRCELA